ncbi:MAG: DUF6057 family protein [Dysgonamonadaceae bacterium]|jgi:hypothetical protein|nr:DUF6057 family protein [Dysgonamonadaceae bacterium]
MNNNKRHTILLPALFFAACWVFFFFYYPYHLYFKEQLTLFGGELAPYLQKPAFLTEWTGDYLTQFYLLTGVGCTILAAVLAVLWQGLCLSFRRLGVRENAGQAALLPVAMEAALSCHLEYPLSMTLGAIIAVWAFVALTCLKNKTLFSVTAYGTAIALYILIGAPFLLFALLVVIKEIRTKRHWVFVSVLLATTLLIPLAASRFYYLTFSQSFYYPIIERYLLKQPFCFLLTEAVLLFAFVLVYYRLKKQFLYALLIIIAPLAVYRIADFKEEYNLALSSEAYFGNWKKVKSLSKQPKYNTYISAYYGNLANAREGKLADELLKQYQPACFGLFLQIGETDSYINLTASPDVLIECGDLAQAQHSAMLAMLFTPHQRSSRMVRKLASIAIANGEYSTAEKYLRLLAKTALHRRWADDNRQFIAGDTIFEFSGKRAFLSRRDTLFSSNDWRPPLVNLLQSNPQNRTAADYLLCYHLLRKDLKQFKADYDDYYYPTFGAASPELYQEALLICLDEFGEREYAAELQKYRIHSEVLNKSHEFLSLHETAQRNERKIRSKFDTTYWFYYFYAQLK